MTDVSDHINAINSVVYHSLYAQTFSSSMLAYLGKAMNAGAFGAAFSSVPWDRNSPGAMDRDFDFDRVPDALDGYFGPGAVAPDM